MKKLLLLAVVVVMGFAHDATAMIHKKNREDEFVPIFHPKIQINEEQYDKRVTLKPLLQLLPSLSSEELKKLDEEKRAARNEQIKKWCDDFKKNSKKSAMWTKDAQEERIVEEACYCDFEEKVDLELFYNLLSEVVTLNYRKTFATKFDFKFLRRVDDLQENEWALELIKKALKKNTTNDILQKQKELVTKEIESFRDPKNCLSFIRSSMKRPEFEKYMQFREITENE
jgi:hypothetical protein